MGKTAIYESLMGQQILFDRVVVKKEKNYVVTYEETAVESVTGVICGVRYRYPGVRMWLNEEGWVYERKGDPVKVLLVYTHPLRRPHDVPYRFAESLLQKFST